MPITYGHTTPLGHHFRQWPELSSSLHLTHQVARRKHASTLNKQLLIVLNDFISLSQHTRDDYSYTLFTETSRSLKKPAFTLYQHKIGHFSHYPFKIWPDLRETENLLFAEHLQQGDRDAAVKGHLSEMLAKLCTSLPGHV